jgi:hypothetical protein
MDWIYQFHKHGISSFKQTDKDSINFILDKNVYVYTLWPSYIDMAKYKVCKANKIVWEDQNNFVSFMWKFSVVNFNFCFKNFVSSAIFSNQDQHLTLNKPKILSHMMWCVLSDEKVAWWSSNQLLCDFWHVNSFTTPEDIRNFTVLCWQCVLCSHDT